MRSLRIGDNSLKISWFTLMTTEIRHTGLIFTSSFNVRPPELLVFDDLQLFCECFVTAGTRKSSFTQEMWDHRWFDGLSRLVLLHSCSLIKAVTFLTNKSEVRDTCLIVFLNLSLIMKRALTNVMLSTLMCSRLYL